MFKLLILLAIVAVASAQYVYSGYYPSYGYGYSGLGYTYPSYGYGYASYGAYPYYGGLSYFKK